ncbi:MAG: hypothetical protein P1U40_06560 [Coxiellaceae bacterium]|nr:hypothetical protein [Coxiellaceae bacterium]
MRKPVFFAIAACSSLFLRVAAQIAFEEKLALLIGDTGDTGKLVGRIAGAAAVGGATAIVFDLMHSKMPDGSLDIDYKAALNPKRNKWIGLHFLMALPIMAAVVETESNPILKLTGSIPRIPMDIIITKNLLHLMVKDNRRFFSELRQNPWRLSKLVALLSIAVPLWLGLGNGTAGTAQKIFGFGDDNDWTAVFKVLGAVGALQFGSSIAHASVQGWSHPSEWSLVKAKSCKQVTQQFVKNTAAVIFTLSICAFYGVLAESGVSNFTKDDGIKNSAFAYVMFVSLPFIQPAVNRLFSIAHRVVCQRRSLRAPQVELTVVGDEAGVKAPQEAGPPHVSPSV